MVAAWLRWSGTADEVWLLPSFAHPFNKPMWAFEHRVALCRALASAVGDWVVVCEIERELPRPSYTIDSLDALAERHPNRRFIWAMGADNLADWHRWKHPERMAEHYGMCVVGRSGYDAAGEGLVFPEVSSTLVRERMAQGLPIDHLVPQGVRACLQRLDNIDL